MMLSSPDIGDDEAVGGKMFVPSGPGRGGGTDAYGLMQSGRYQIGYGGQRGQLMHLPFCKAPHPFAVVECTCPASATLSTATPVEKLSLIQYDEMYDKVPLPDHKIRAIRTRLRKLYPDDPRYARRPGEEDYQPRQVERAYLAKPDPDGLWSVVPQTEDPNNFAEVPAHVAEKQGYRDIHDPWADASDSFWKDYKKPVHNDYSAQQFDEADRAYAEREARRRARSQQSPPLPPQGVPPMTQPQYPGMENNPPTPSTHASMQHYPPQYPVPQYAPPPGYPAVVPTQGGYPQYGQPGYPPPPTQVPPIMTAAQNLCREPHILELMTPYGPVQLAMECALEQRPHKGMPHMAELPARIPGMSVRIAWVKDGE